MSDKTELLELSYKLESADWGNAPKETRVLLLKTCDAIRLSLSDSEPPPPDDVRSVLATAREEIVLTIAFLGRDAGSDRLADTITGLISRLAKADAAIIAALRSATVSCPAPDRETIRTLLDLLNPLHGSLDKQTYDEKVKQNFDAPRDFEYDVGVTAQQERDLTQAVCILEDRLRAPAVGVTREAIALPAIAPHACSCCSGKLHLNGARYCCDQQSSESFHIDDLSVAYLSPVPEATVSARDAVIDREHLRRLVDIVWNEATESSAVPSTDWADRLIDRSLQGAKP